VGLDYRAADRQAHARAMGFCREECIEERFDVFRFDARAGVGYVDRDTLTTGECRAHLEQAGAIGNRPHRVDGIRDQVQDDFLQLTFTGRYDRQIRGQISDNVNAFRSQFGARELENLAYNSIDGEWASFSTGYLEQRADAFDHLGSTMAISDDLLEGRSRLEKIRDWTIKPAQACAAICQSKSGWINIRFSGNAVILAAGLMLR